jgi:glycosyltransferase involved in cell wall biosynthesis
MISTTTYKRPDPAVSVVIPCRNERSHIEACVRSVLAQQPVTGDFEVIVVDGMSDDGTREILARLASDDARLRVVVNRARSTARGMNIGIQHARGEYIAIMGAHNHYAPDYLAASLKVSRATGADNVGGSMICRGETWIQQAIALAHHSPFSVGGARWHKVHYEGPADTVFGGFYRREVFARIGEFDESLLRNQDDELNLRLTLAGGKIWHSPAIRSTYCPRASLSALFHQYLQYGYWKVAVMKKHWGLASLRQIVPAAFVLALAILPLAALFYVPVIFLWLGLLAAYAIANLSAATIAAAQSGWRFLPVLPLVFAGYHFGYGIGFVRGVFGFLIFRRAPALTFSRLTRAS